jgi:hypothetical protein
MTQGTETRFWWLLQGRYGTVLASTPIDTGEGEVGSCTVDKQVQALSHTLSAVQESLTFDKVFTTLLTANAIVFHVMYTRLENSSALSKKLTVTTKLWGCEFWGMLGVSLAHI